MKLDKQRRLKIPHSLLKEIGYLSLSNIPLPRLRLSIQENKIILFYNSSKIEYHDAVSVDDKDRIILKNYVLEQAGIDASTEFFVSALKEQIIIRWK